MKKRILFYFNFFLLTSILLGNSQGDLALYMHPNPYVFEAVPGGNVRFVIYYYTNNVSATNVSVNFEFSNAMQVVSTEPSVGVASNSCTWNIGNISGAYVFDSLVVNAKVNDSAVEGDTVKVKAVISGTAAGDDLSNNSSEFSLPVLFPKPDLWVFHWGLMESLENGYFFAAEKDVPAKMEIHYFNFSFNKAENVVVTDTLPEGAQFISSTPAASSVSGNVITWNVGDMDGFGYGKIDYTIKPTAVGSNLKSIAWVQCTNDDRNPANNSASFSFQVLALMQPIVLKPYTTSTDTLIMPSNPKFSGLARAGATVSMYTSDYDFCFDFGSCNMTKVGEAVAKADRTWEIIPSGLSESKTYNVYFRATLGSESSTPALFWQAKIVRVEAMFDSSGFDIDHFIVETGDQSIAPGALGGTSGTVPDVDIVIKKRQKAPDDMNTDQNKWAYHAMKLVVNETDTLDWPVTEIKRPDDVSGNVLKSGGADKTEDWTEWDYIYVHKGFGPGSKIEIWCRPVYYNDQGLALVGLVYVKCHEILIDPAGYVYDIDLAGSEYEWPAVPPESSFITNATVTTYHRTGDTNWAVWDAEASGQVNPQVTDTVTNDRILQKGYFAFYVPSGQYKVEAEAPNYADYESPILTVVDAPVFHNVGMRKSAMQSISVSDKFNEFFDKTRPTMFTLYQNYPNPFNPYTTLSYYLPKQTNVTLRIYDALGREVETLLYNETRDAGFHTLKFDGSKHASGVYIYSLTAGAQTVSKKLVLLK